MYLKFYYFFNVSFVAYDNVLKSLKWHARLSHIGKDRMTRLTREGMFGPLKQISLPPCKSCVAGKTIRKPF